ncbi:hypothetical protein EIN_275040 [Entamoeba invadens IP1]|uniref:Alpha-L-rhamnosidase six-hairpin glycosidase domain-containing protein n=1 Tax=Entamoeba invadens IP1 TaxID=370355 RepID=A0A0A1U1M8_ENTIV|nr:hypothetical protein EIN_275040 [Entamoeba invadens IP1]ELP87917.1 hypothetical protein EIN_275040 [Entamoeba invadens IP1]|eukprot:XP_004254688.1 hypothetical protein EIN_275040 [Entamoeba invadens IP1]
MLYIYYTLFLLLEACAIRQNPSYVMTNYRSMMMGWTNTYMTAVDPPTIPPGLSQFRHSQNWNTNLINKDSFVLKINTVPYTESNLFSGKNSIDYPGYYSHIITAYNNTELPLKITKKYFFEAEQDTLLENVIIENTSPEDITVEYFQYTDYPVSIQSTEIYAGGIVQYSDYVVITGMLEKADYADIGSSESNTPLSRFINSEDLKETSYLGNNAQIGLNKKMLIEKGTNASFTIFRSVTLNINAAKDLQSFYNTTIEDCESTFTKYIDEKFRKYKLPAFNTLKEEKMWYSSVFTSLYSQNPTLGTLLASFHPGYGWKMWTRDGTFEAMILMALGETEGAKKYLEFMMTATLNDDEYFHSCYDWFTGGRASMPEPQNDGMGVVAYALYYYYTITKDVDFFMKTETKRRIQKIEKFLLYSEWKNLVKADYSNWEESSDSWTGLDTPKCFWAFTQIQAHHGLLALSKLEKVVYNNIKKENELIQRAEKLATSFEKLFWNEEKGYFVEAIWQDSKKQKVILDSSTATMVFSGIVKDDEKVLKHFEQIRKQLTKLTYGMARYSYDTFFYRSRWSSKEVGEACPPWGVTTMFMTWAEMIYDEKDKHAYLAPYRIQWMIDHSGPDFIPAGEAIDGVSGEPVLSSMPDVYEHGGVYILSVLQYQKLIPLFSYNNW